MPRAAPQRHNAVHALLDNVFFPIRALIAVPAKYSDAFAAAAATARATFDIAFRPLPLAAVVTAFYAVYAAWHGPIIAVDSAWYQQSGDVLVACNFNPSCYVERVNYAGFLSVLYIGYTAVVGAVRALANGSASWILLAINVAAMGAAAWVTLRSVARLVPGSRRALIVAALALVLVYDLVYWIPWILTDATFAALMTGVVALVVRAACAGNRADATYALAMALMLAGISSLWRPTGLVLIAWVALCALLIARRHVGPRARRITNVAIATIAVASALSLGLVVLALADPGVVPHPGLRSLVRDLMQSNLAQGNTTYEAPVAVSITGPASVLSQAFKRAVYFYAFTAPGFSLAHLAVNWLVYVPLYVLSGLGAIAAIRNGTPARRDVAIALTVLLVGFAIFHALTIIDGEWRYRLPCYPPLAILAALGVAGTTGIGPRGSVA